MVISRRFVRPELMDDPSLNADEHRRALAGLARLNGLAHSADLIWKPLARLAREWPRPVSLLDLATGSGDLPLALARRASACGLDLRIHACDVSPVAIARARKRAQRHPAPIEFFQADVRLDWPEGEWDVVTCSLFLHHLSTEDAISLLARMRETSRRAVLVSDLRRGAWGLGLAACVPPCVTRSRVVRIDAVRSVRAAFTPQEASELVHAAKLNGAVVRRAWPARILIEWVRR